MAKKIELLKACFGIICAKLSLFYETITLKPFISRKFEENLA